MDMITQINGLRGRNSTSGDIRQLPDSKICCSSSPYRKCATQPLSNLPSFRDGRTQPRKHFRVPSDPQIQVGFLHAHLFIEKWIAFGRREFRRVNHWGNLLVEKCSIPGLTQHVEIDGPLDVSKMSPRDGSMQPRHPVE